jgi:hypothetical protein
MFFISSQAFSIVCAFAQGGNSNTNSFDCHLVCFLTDLIDGEISLSQLITNALS